MITAPDVPAWLDLTNGALSCQHSRVDLLLAALIVVTLRREGVGGRLDTVKAGPINV